ncbi:hypothetical protein ACLOJK_022896 [Asimina triloba]
MPLANQSQSRQQLVPQNLSNTTTQNSTGLPSALSSVSGLNQNAVSNVVSQGSNMQAMPGISQNSMTSSANARKATAAVSEFTTAYLPAAAASTPAFEAEDAARKYSAQPLAATHAAATAAAPFAAKPHAVLPAVPNPNAYI